MNSEYKQGLGLAASLLLWIVAGGWTLFLVANLSRPHNACGSIVPPFEGLKVENVEVAWPPPLIRCTLVDLDPSQYGETGVTSIWAWPDVVPLVIIDALALVEAARRARKRRQTKGPLHQVVDNAA